jgi:hypothetical protein
MFEDYSSGMDKRLLREGIGWGALLWLIGYILGMVFFMFVPHELIGWFIMPIGIILSLWVLLKKVKEGSVQYFLKIAVIWTLIAVVLDYLFIVKLLKPADGYYKLDVYIYYFSTFVLPLFIGWRKNTSTKQLL